MVLAFREHFRALLPRNSFLRGVIAMAGGTVGAQAVVIASSPILTRLYTPGEFGVMAVFVGLSAILSVLATWRYEIAIPQADDDQAAASLVALCFVLCLVAVAFSSVVIFVFHEAIVSLFHLGNVAGFLWLIPLFIFALGLFQLLSFWHFRKRQFAAVATSTVGRNLGMVVLQMLLYPLGALALLGGQLVGQLLSSVLLLCRSKVLFRQKISLSVLRYNAWRFRKYPLYSSWSGVTGSVGQQAPMLMFAAMFSPLEAGLYVLAYRMTSLPSTLVGKAVTNVFLPHAADAYRDGDLGELLAKVHDVLARIAMPGVVLLAIIAPPAFAFVFGDEWREAGYFVRWLTVMLYASFIYSPISTSFGIMNRQEMGLLLHVALMAVSVFSIWMGAYVFDSALTAVALYSVARAILYAVAIVWIHRTAGGRASSLLAPIVLSGWRSVPLAIPVALATFWPMPVWAIAVLCAAAAMLVFLYYKPLLWQLRAASA